MNNVDITAFTVGLLPAVLAERLKAIELRLGKRVTFLENRTLPGGAGGKATLDGTVHLAPRSMQNLNVIGEEIMHLDRWTSGYPIVEPTTLAVQNGYARGLTQLAGHFDEHAFFPFLESIGLDPRRELTPTIQPAIQALTAHLQQIKNDGATAEWRVLLSVTYVQTSLIAPASESRDSLLRMFGDSVLAEYAALGEHVAAEIAAAQNEAPNEVEQRLRSCVYDALALSEKAAVVKRPF